MGIRRDHVRMINIKDIVFNSFSVNSLRQLYSKLLDTESNKCIIHKYIRLFFRIVSLTLEVEDSIKIKKDLFYIIKSNISDEVIKIKNVLPMIKFLSVDIKYLDHEDQEIILNIVRRYIADKNNNETNIIYAISVLFKLFQHINDAQYLQETRSLIDKLYTYNVRKKNNILSNSLYNATQTLYKIGNDIDKELIQNLFEDAIYSAENKYLYYDILKLFLIYLSHISMYTKMNDFIHNQRINIKNNIGKYSDFIYFLSLCNLKKNNMKLAINLVHEFIQVYDVSHDISDRIRINIKENFILIVDLFVISGNPKFAFFLLEKFKFHEEDTDFTILRPRLLYFKNLGFYYENSNVKKAMHFYTLAFDLIFSISKDELNKYENKEVDTIKIFLCKRIVYLYQNNQIEFDDNLITFLKDEITLVDSTNTNTNTKTKKKKKSKKKKKTEINECPICLLDLEEYETIKLDCNHIFHITCIEEWYNKDKSCPYCRSAL